MRVMLATFGVLMVPLAWYTSKELKFSNMACHLTTIMVLCGALPAAFVNVGLDFDVSGRFGLAYHLQIHPSRFDALVLHGPDSILPHQVP